MIPTGVENSSPASRQVVHTAAVPNAAHASQDPRLIAEQAGGDGLNVEKQTLPAQVLRVEKLVSAGLVDLEDVAAVHRFIDFDPLGCRGELIEAQKCSEEQDSQSPCAHRAEAPDGAWGARTGLGACPRFETAGERPPVVARDTDPLQPGPAARINGASRTRRSREKSGVRLIGNADSTSIGSASLRSDLSDLLVFSRSVCGT